MSPTFSLHQSLGDEWKVFRVRVLNSFIVTAFHFVLYGLYIPLFRTSLRLLAKRTPSRSRTYHELSLIALFILASIAVPLSSMFDILHIAVAYFDNPNPFYTAQIDIQICRYVIMFTMMFIIDSVLIFRCFVIFGSRNKLYAPLIAVGLVGLIDLCGMVSSIWTEVEFMQRIGSSTFSTFFNLPQYVANGFVALSALVNFTLTGILACRIWYISWRNRELQVLRGRDPADQRIDSLKTVVAILLESGLIYFLIYVVFIIGNLVEESYDIGSILIQIGGITPTLIFVRANVNSPQDSDTSTIDVRSHTPNSEFGRSIHTQSFTDTLRDDSSIYRERKGSDSSSQVLEIDIRPRALKPPTVVVIPATPPKPRVESYASSSF